MGTRRQAHRDDEPWLAREIFDAALYVAAGAGALLFFFLAGGWLLAAVAEAGL